MKIKTILTATAGLLALAACNNEQEWESTYLGDPNAVIVNATLQGEDTAGASTRANTESTGDAFVIGTDRFRVTNTTPNTAGTTPATTANAGTNTAHYTYTAPATWSLTDAAGTPVTSPYLTWAEGENTFEAYMPVGETTTTYATFTLPGTQTDVDKLRAADWMTATATKARTDADRTVDLRFTHRLAKVTVSITAYRNEFGTTPPTLESVQFKLPTLDLATGVTLPTAQTVLPLVSPDASPAALHSYTAILAPGKYAAGADFLTMTIAGQPVTVKVNDLLATTGLTPGKSYTFQLTVGNHIATLTSFTVGEWTAGTPLDATNNPGLVLAPGTGTPTYEIHSAQGLKAFADLINGTDDGADRIFCGIAIPGTSTLEARKSNARLMADIDLSTLCGATIGTDGKGKSWKPIGKGLDYSYQGVFEGNHHTVKGLYIDDTRTGFDTGSGTIYQGLFGFAAGATVQRLTVTGSVNLSITAAQGKADLSIYAGGITGFAYGSTLTDCHSEVSVSAEGDEAAVNTTVRAGGIAGVAINGGIGGSLNDCTSTGVVTATASTTNSSQELAFAGGICGESSDTPLTGCSHTTGAVSAATAKGTATVGGVVGSASSQFLGCTNTAAVSGSATDATTGILHIGGVAGWSSAEVVACSNSGAITFNAGGELYAGGVVGLSLKSIVASFSTEVPTAGQGGGNGAEGQSHIGGILGYLNSLTATVSTSFYVGSNELGTNGVYSVDDVVGGITNTDGGIIPTSAGLNGKVKAMNDAIDTYNTGAFSANGTVPAITCPYRWTKTAAAPKVRK
ncbi:fimbrillin family protein [Bacteroides sp.]|uniref:fimbrillin family protein n=1 Tax=Bacteroides sp. TaxID=29523 RepID=UPI002604E392|nr:fimbrillin family protein [Bacteroides sp.]